MRELSDAETERSQEQMLAICHRAWRGGRAEGRARLAALFEEVAELATSLASKLRKGDKP